MKNSVLSACAIFLFLGLTSCSTDETQDFEALQTKTPLLKSYILKKDINGRYSIDYTTNDNATIESVQNTQSNSNDIYLYSGETAGKERYNENLTLNNNQLNVNFVENSKKTTSFIIEDDAIVLAKGEKNNKFLQEHSFTVNPNEKTVALDFKVRKDVNVAFSYNEQEDIYEIHLKEGKNNGSSFSKIFVNDGSTLKIDFVNHITLASKGGKSPTVTSKVKRPRSIIIWK